MVKIKGKKLVIKKKRGDVFIQCGYEDDCKSKDCLNCHRKNRYDINLTLAEEICIEDFAMCDLDSMINGGEISSGLCYPDKKAELDLMQNIMRKLMHKMFSKQDKDGKTSKIGKTKKIKQNKHGKK